MSILQSSIHTQAYMQALIAVLESPDTKTLHLTRLKRVGLVTGGLLAGTVLGGPIGLIAGAGVAGSKAYHMKHYDENFARMLDVMRSLTDEQKQQLVTETEHLVGTGDTDDLVPFVKVKQNREKLLNLVSNFLLEEAGYTWPDADGVQKKSTAPKDNGTSGSPYKRLGALAD